MYSQFRQKILVTVYLEPDVEHYNSRKAAEEYHRTFTKDMGNPELKIKASERYRKFISELRPGARILDAGCGTGRFIKYFIKDGFKVTGIDLSISMIEIATQTNPEASFRVMDMCNLDFPDHSFDGMWNVATILHLNEFEVLKTFQESKRVLKKRWAFIRCHQDCGCYLHFYRRGYGRWHYDHTLLLTRKTQGTLNLSKF